MSLDEFRQELLPWDTGSNTIRSRVVLPMPIMNGRSFLTYLWDLQKPKSKEDKHHRENFKKKEDKEDISAIPQM